MAVDMVEEGLIDKEEAIMRVEPHQLDQLLHPVFDPKAKRTQIAKGIAASPGAATGRIVFKAKDAKEWHDRKEKVILVRLETTPEDIEGMNVAQGILTCRGGKTSHAAVVARGMGRCCITGCEEIILNEQAKTMTASGKVYHEGDYISLEGSEGKVFEGKIDTIKPSLSGDFGKLMSWSDEFRRLKVRTNADTPKDAKVARDFGAQGIGLTRTEHMFFEGERIKYMREMILSSTLEQREKALTKLLKFQRDDFYGILLAMEGLPVNIRTLDPPLHEFLPSEEEHIIEIAKEMNLSVDKVHEKIKLLHESNPMLGHRGCRLGVVMPEITRMQARAIFEAAAQLTKEGHDVHPEVMIPIVSTTRELELERANVENTAAQVIKETGVHFHYKVGTMIEIPRAAIIADQIAKYAEFYSFGTNDLTQMTFGYSRDDATKFLPFYLENKILPVDPFVSIDQQGVGFLMERAVTLGRKTRPDLVCGICGEHGGEPDSVKFCHKIGLDYVSCSPFRVPIARLAAAHAAIIEKRQQNKSN
jgi:pyruvate,orthophosphate dikinase